MKSPAHPTFAFTQPRPNIPFEDIGTYREGLENLPDEVIVKTDRSILTLAAILGVIVLSVAFWPVIKDFFGASELAFLLGWVIGIVTILGAELFMGGRK